MLVDAFLFFNEFELLKVRLSYLGPHVDKFLIVESPYDFSGRQKSTHLNESFISKLPYSEKISTLSWRPGISQKILITLARSTRRSNLLWMIQHWQRNAVLKLAEGISDSAQVLFGDLDEFPSVESISRLTEVNPGCGEIFGFQQRLFYYNLSNLISDHWHGTAICSMKTLRQLTPKYLRKGRNAYPVRGSGWHFSYFTEAERIRKKLLATASVEKQEFALALSEKDIQNKIQSKQDIYSRSLFVNVVSSSEFPPELIESFQKFYPIVLEPLKDDW